MNKPLPASHRDNPPALALLVLCGLVGLLLAGCLPSAFGAPGPERLRLLETVFVTASATPSNTLAPSASPLPSGTSTPVPPSTATPAPPTEVPINPGDGARLVFVPAGEFKMGSKTGDPYFWGAEGPVHTVSLAGYYIYQTEVTNGMYQACAQKQQCPLPDGVWSRTRSKYYGNPKYDDYPVVLVSWVSAASYCLWAGARLPSEAEWEKAARGTDQRLFPWGNDDFPDGMANLCDAGCAGGNRLGRINDGYNDTAPVGSYPLGASPYGALDMAGNAWEWVFDVFDGGYYQASPLESPRGPATGKIRVMRGGSFVNLVDALRTTVRIGLTSTKSLDTLGFRCAMDALP